MKKQQDNSTHPEMGGPIELRICKGGCSCGPGQIPSVYDSTPVDGAGKLLVDGPPRVFQEPKKKTFTVNW